MNYLVIMIRNYLKIALRNLKRNKFYSAINILGLATGIACFILIVIFIRDELSYDAFHSKKERIYRVCEKLDAEEGQGENSSSQPFPVAQALITDYSQLIEQTVRFFNFQESSHTLQYKDIKINEKRTFFADSSLFKIFDFQLEKGNPDKVLSEINSIVLSKELARKYFGEEDPMGKIIKYDGKVELMVTGIFGKLPAQSHIHFDCLISFTTLKNLMGPNIGSKNWVWNPCWTYILLKDGVSPAELEKQFPSFIKKHFPDFIIPQATLYLQKLTDIHLTSKLDYELEPNSSRSDIYILGAIGVFILVIACINFMNLSTARSAKRSKEVGMRKVFGSYRSQLIQQFLGESFILSLFALVVAVCLVLLLLPVFSNFSGKYFSIAEIVDLKLFGILLGVTIVVGIVSGIYPALFLSAFQPTEVLKGTFSPGKKSKTFRQSLVVMQFAISLGLIIATLVIYKQLRYLRSADLGFNKEQVIVLPVRPPMAKSYVPFSEELIRSGRVLNVSTMNDMLGVSHNTHEYNYEGMPQNKQWIYFPALIVGPTFIQTMGMQLVAGRAFDKNNKTDDSLSVVINEAMVKHLGWGTPQNALGKQFFTPGGKERVIGVVKDFNFVSLKEPVGPFVLDMSSRFGKLFWIKYLVVRVAPKNVKETIDFIESKWNEFSNEYPFEYFFLDENINKTYKAQDNLGKLVGYFAALAIFIACLGLFALSSFTAEQRTKEIGIRKVLGAPVYSLVNLMSKEFLKLVLLSALIAWPVAWFIMNNWLNNFAFRINIGMWVFVLSALAGFLIALFTVSFHAFRSASNNPVKALKYE
jgi:putative ABC transport system permease protein